MNTDPQAEARMSFQSPPESGEYPDIGARVFSGWNRQAPPEREAMRRLHEEGKTEREIARLLGVSRRHVAEAMVGAGVQRRRSGLPRPVPGEVLHSLVVGEGLSQGQLAHMFGVAAGT